MGAHDWVAGIASHGSVILSRGRLVRVEAPGYNRHPSSIQHDAVVKHNMYRCVMTVSENAKVLYQSFHLHVVTTGQF